MRMTDIPFHVTDWASVEATIQRGTSGVAYCRTVQCGDIRVRMLQCRPGFVSDHWCAKGHILLCLEGELLTELGGGRAVVLTRGMSFQVADDGEPHRSSTRSGATVFVVD